MTKYILLLHENPSDFANVTPAEMQAMIERYTAWATAVRASGKVQQGMKLEDNGGWHMRSSAAGAAVTDGPYAEAKDVVGGFYVIEASSDAEAQEIAASCPHLDAGWVELRRVEIG
jgi:hypothetical protein